METEMTIKRDTVQGREECTSEVGRYSAMTTACSMFGIYNMLFDRWQELGHKQNEFYRYVHFR